MNIIEEYYLQAELAFAAYFDLEQGVDPVPALQDGSDGMSSFQATAFAERWTIVDSVEDFNTGLSATVFQKNDGSNEKYLAIRGTEGVLDYVADFFVLAGLPSFLNPQYVYLKQQVQDWIDNGVLDTDFTVTGHSLGGYLAAGLTADFPDNVTHAYLYNSPGNNSAISTILEELGAFGQIDQYKITEIQADAGISPISGLWSDFSEALRIHIENQFLSGVSDPPSAYNHSQRVLTDSLAVYSIYSRVSQNLNIADITDIIKGSDYNNASTLELSIEKLATVFNPNQSSIQEGDREALYEAITSIDENLGLYFDLTILPINKYSTESIVLSAENSIAFRYALKY